MTTADGSPALPAHDSANADDDALGPAGQPDGGSLDRALLRGLGWTWISNWGTQIVSWISTIVVARLLTPADYGVVAMATVFLGLTRLMSEFGLGTAVLAMREMRDEELAQVNGLSMLLGIAAVALTWLAATPLGWFFASDELPTVVAVMGLGFVASALRVVPYALLQRELRFDTLARIEVLQALVMTGTTLTLAAAGAGYWALALGPLVGQAAATAANVRLRPVSFARPTRTITETLRFSRNILVERLAGYGYTSADSLIIGRLLGDGPLGLYTLARSLGAIAVDKVTGMTMRVTPAVFAAAQDDPPALRRYVYLLTEGLAVATFPVCVGTALVAPEFVPLFLGEEWQRITVPLQLIALQGVIPAVTSIFPQILIVTGQSAYVMRNGLFALAVVPAGLLLGARYGVAGVAAAWFVCLPVVRGPLFWRARSTLDLGARRFVRAMWPAASSSLVMAAAVAGTSALLSARLPLALHFAAKVAIGAVAYGAMLAVVHRARVRAVVQSLRALRSRPTAAADAVRATPAGGVATT